MQTFSVTTGMVRAHYFPTLADFDTSTTPLAATVTEMIAAESAEMIGRLAAAGVVADNLSAATTPASFAWCQDTVRLGAAIRAAKAMVGFSGAVEDWEKALAARYELLTTKGYVILGDAPTPADNPNGPVSHISNHHLDTGDEDLISSVIPKFRRDDML